MIMTSAIPFTRSGALQLVSEPRFQHLRTGVFKRFIPRVAQYTCHSNCDKKTLNMLLMISTLIMLVQVPWLLGQSVLLRAGRPDVLDQLHLRPSLQPRQSQSLVHSSGLYGLTGLEITPHSLHSLTSSLVSQFRGDSCPFRSRHRLHPLRVDDPLFHALRTEGSLSCLLRIGARPLCIPRTEGSRSILLGHSRLG